MAYKQLLLCMMMSSVCSLSHAANPVRKSWFELVRCFVINVQEGSTSIDPNRSCSMVPGSPSGNRPQCTPFSRGLESRSPFSSSGAQSSQRSSSSSPRSTVILGKPALSPVQRAYTGRSLSQNSQGSTHVSPVLETLKNENRIMRQPAG